MTDRIVEWLDESQRLADQAAEGPWGHWPEAGTIEVTANNHATVICNAVRPQGGWGTPIYQGGVEPTAAFIAESRTRFPQAVAALREVMKRHRPVEVEPSETICSACSHRRGWGESVRYSPAVEHPCATLRLVEAELGLGGDGDA